jgi:hypothetical protein
MKRFQVYLRPDQIDVLRTLSKRRGTSMSELVREGVDKIFEELPPEENPLLDIIGIFDSGVGDLSEKHDEYLSRTIQEENQGGG